MIDWDHERKVASLPLVKPLCVSPRMDLVQLLTKMKKGGSLLAFVCAWPDLATKALNDNLPVPAHAGFMGIVTLEDIMEALLQ
jgi:CBS domain containing-hemolysin-like protein